MKHRETHNVQARRLASASNGFPLREWRTVRGLTGFATEAEAQDAAAEWLVNDWPPSPDDAIQTRIVSGTF